MRRPEPTLLFHSWCVRVLLSFNLNGSRRWFWVCLDPLFCFLASRALIFDKATKLSQPRSSRQSSKNQPTEQESRQAGRPAEASKRASSPACPASRLRAHTDRETETDAYTQVCSARIIATRDQMTPKVELQLRSWQPCMHENKFREKKLSKSSPYTHRLLHKLNLTRATAQTQPS